MYVVVLKDTLNTIKLKHNAALLVAEPLIDLSTAPPIVSAVLRVIKVVGRASISLLQVKAVLRNMVGTVSQRKILGIISTTIPLNTIGISQEIDVGRDTNLEELQASKPRQSRMPVLLQFVEVGFILVRSSEQEKETPLILGRMRRSTAAMLTLFPTARRLLEDESACLPTRLAHNKI